MTKEKFKLMASLEHKVNVGFFSTAIFCLLLLILLHITSESNVIPCSGGDCKVGSILSALEAAREQHIRQVVANLREENSTSGTQQQQEVLEEWRLPALTTDWSHKKLDDPAIYGEARRFMPLGNRAFLFIQFGAYRGGPKPFAVVGLGTKGLHKHGKPDFECSWVSNGDNTVHPRKTRKYYPDWGYSRQYSVVIVNCMFNSDVGVDGSGGRLEMVAKHVSLDQTGLPDVHFVALTEEPNKYDVSLYGPPYKYDYLFCGSPMYGMINPQRMREWIAYHVRLFGPRLHFILDNAGGFGLKDAVVVDQKLAIVVVIIACFLHDIHESNEPEFQPRLQNSSWFRLLGYHSYQ